MKKRNLKRLIFSILISIMILFSTMFSHVVSQFNYDTPIPLGEEVNLVVGLSEEEQAKAIKEYYENPSEVAKIERIYYNFLKSIDEEKYFAGAYWEGEPFLLNDKGEQILDERERPLKNYDRTFYILVTDKNVIPEEDIHPKIFFREVKYSYAQLEKYMITVSENLTDKGLIYASTGYGLKENKINIMVSNKCMEIEKQIIELIPEDSFICEYRDPEECKFVDVANVAVINGSTIIASGNPTDYYASVGFPVIWGSGTTSKGWLTTGHFAYDNASVKWGAYTLGTLGNRNSPGTYSQFSGGSFL